MIRMSLFSKGCWALAVVLCILMPSQQSLWMDEAQTYRLASMPSLSLVAEDLSASFASEALMPLGVTVAWFSARVTSHSEWGLRAVNILWGVLAVWAFAEVGRRWRIPWAPLFLAVQPFLWFYMNEARPYAFQIASASWLVAGCVIVFEEKRLRQSVFLILLMASCALVATTLFGILMVGSVWGALLWVIWQGRWPRPAWWGLSISAALFWMGGLGVYYLMTLSRGAGGVKLWDVGLQNIVFTVYEIAGFSGLGPARNEIRELAHQHGSVGVLRVFWESYPGLICLGAVYVAILGCVFLRWKSLKNNPLALWFGGIFGVSFGSLVLLAVVEGFPIWGRHFAPNFPFFCALMLLGIGEVRLLVRPLLFKGLLSGLFLLLAWSAFGLRFESRHEKDDYRRASSLAKQALSEGKSVWWSADPEAARYYGLGSIKNLSLSGLLTFTRDVSPPEILDRSVPPGIIFVSKPDAFDPSGKVLDFVRVHQYRRIQKLSGFEVFQIPNAQEAGSAGPQK